MNVSNKYQTIAALIGEPVRALMLWNLLDGRALTATELAIRTDTSMQNTSMHLGKLVKAELLAVEKQGRHRYYRFAKPEVAYALEAIASLLPKEGNGQLGRSANYGDDDIRYCRTCYDHLAGKVGVALTDQLIKKRFLFPTDNQYQISGKGEKWFANLDISIDDLKSCRRVFARQCLDWSERRHHLAGALGAAFLEKMIQLGWFKGIRSSRVMYVTEKGQKALYKELQLKL
jgi:DNA-binding transcriptional ArsR family regulator